ncbi:acyl-CoA-binding domain-containing protein 5A-like isoform X1 [Syngnathoides biaculeatus]|uniref:acyl-CoA-binding domain-containing protein 5A-like isoform X1 n=1 Tax=Syngnathoides biaculeatus TaxID=300417 RepID=UPI002ADE500A|nr:acyl-CoA-binding domain-containing protein 5A-like isoform X1 [Syngnathoides biaculeatus]
MAPDGAQPQTLRAKFAAAVKVICSLPKQGPFQLSDDMMLMFYSYYKQATVGPCTFARPTGFWDSHQKNKWDAWSSLGNMTKEEAMKNYVENIQLILETMPISNEVSDLVQQLGDFVPEEEEEEEEDTSEERELDRRPFATQAGGKAHQEPEKCKYFFCLCIRCTSQSLFSFISRGVWSKGTCDGRQAHFPTSYGDLWDDIQNVHDEEGGVGFNGREAGGCDRGRETPRKDESSEDDRTDDEDKVDGKGRRLPAAEDTAWRRYAAGSGSSSEPSVSSLTNGNRSSLNSEAEEEELACSKEFSTRSPVCLHFWGHAADGNVAVKKSCHLADSDNEEFCDSMDHPATEKIAAAAKIHSGGSATALVTEQDLWFESSSTLKIEDSSHHGDSYHRESHEFVRDRQSPKTTCSSQQCFCTYNGTRPRGDVDEQIVAALARLQDDMADALRRLRALEVLAVAQSSSSSRCADSPAAAQKFLTPSWWPFDRCPIAVVVTALWPAVVYVLVQLYSQRKRRKIT